MKKTPKKLVLSKETLKNLEDAELSKADGGYPPSVLKTCPTWFLDC